MSGYIAASSANEADDELVETTLPIFNVEPVSLQFKISADFVAAAVANNVLVVALASGRILRIDLERAEDIDDIDLPKPLSTTGPIRRLFLDPTASHLIITTALGESFYLHTQSRQPKPLARLKGVVIEAVGWNPSQPTASTREIILGAADGNVYEVFIDPSIESGVGGSWRRDERYLRNVWKADGRVTGMFVDAPDRGVATQGLGARSDAGLRRVLITTEESIYCWVGRVEAVAGEGTSAVFSRFFEREAPTTFKGEGKSGPAILAISPENNAQWPTHGNEPVSSKQSIERAWAWLNGRGVVHGKLASGGETSGLANDVFSDAKSVDIPTLLRSQTSQIQSNIPSEHAQCLLLTQWHIVQLVGGRLIATNRLNDAIIMDHSILGHGQEAIALIADTKKSTYWLFTTQAIFEIVVTEEERDIWKIMLGAQKFEFASRFARTAAQRDAVATASGDALVQKKKFLEAASVYGRSSKPFEEVSLTFIDNNEQDALRKYLLTKLANLKKTALMQRTMLSTWLIEIYMSKLNSLDDTITTKAELAEGMNTAQSQDQLAAVRKEFQNFTFRHKDDFDKKTTYDIISSHGREEELLFYATAINDYNYVLAYWIQRDRWQESLDTLEKQTDAEAFYRYSTILMANVPVRFVDILMRQDNLTAENLIPALLNYNKYTQVSQKENQAVRYLSYCITQQQSTSPAVHNTLVSVYASSPTQDESQLLSYLQAQSYSREQNYDLDFALRLCIQHNRVHSCVHIYCAMGLFSHAVDIALKHDEVDLAASVADRPENNTPLRKKLWLKVAKVVIGKTEGIKDAMEFLKRCDLLRIEDLIPFFPDFVVIDDFKEEICIALEEYSRHIDGLKREMDNSAKTAANVKSDIKALDARYAVVEPGERCFTCQLPLLIRQFFVFPCQHTFHADCLSKTVLKQSGIARARRLKELQLEVSRGMSAGRRRDESVKELDELLAKECALCSDGAVREIDKPFVTDSEEKQEWAL